MRVGVLTGGGDCPGLNAVIRAVVRKGVKEYGYEFVGFRDGWRGPLENLTMPLGIDRGPRHPAARRHDPRSSRTNPFKVEGGVEQIKDEPRRQRRRRADRDRRRGHPRRRHQARRPRRQRRRRAEDDRQRPVRHRLHVRLRHRRQHRDGGHRPAAHHRRVAPPRARRRGDGPPRRLDRAARRHRRRRQRRADPRAALRHRPGLRATSRSASRRTTSPIIVVSEGAVPGRGRRHDADERREGRVRSRPAGRHRRPARQGDRGAHRQGGARRRARPRPARRHADRVRPLARHPLRPARDHRGPDGTSARWWRCAAPTSSGCRWPRAPASSSSSSPRQYAEAEVFFG